MINLNKNYQSDSLKCVKYAKTKLFVVCPLLLLILATSQFNIDQSVNGQMNTDFQNQAVTNESLDMQPTQNISQQMTSEIIKPDSQIVVLANDLFEIRDNIAEARESLDKGNFFELAQNIENLDHLVTVIINPLPHNTTAFEQNKSPANNMSTTNTMPSLADLPSYNTTQLSETSRGIDGNKLAK